MKQGYGLVCSRDLLEAQQGEIWPMGIFMLIFPSKGKSGA
jgi:hypothetical protein